MDTAVLTRIGVQSELTYEAYTSTSFIGAADSYPTALSKLDASVNAIVTDIAKEEFQVVGVGGTTTFIATTIAWNVLNSIVDIQVFVDGRKQTQDVTGAGIQDYIKLSSTQIQFSYVVPEFARITVRDERTGGGGGGGGATDLTNIIVDPQPDTNGNHALGTVAKGWKSVFLKDKVTAQVYELEIVSGVFQITPRP
jgi:hypothetical protein